MRFRNDFRIMMFLIGIATLLHVVSFAEPAGVVQAAENDPAEVVAGRLGGTIQSLIDRFGEPDSINPAVGPIFAIDGFGYVGVQTHHIQGTAGLEERSRAITASSPRPFTLSALEPDPADWTLAEAITRAESLLPLDVEVTDAIPFAHDQQIAICRSQALGVIFGVAADQCRITFLQPTAETVSFITLSLAERTETSESDTPATEACAGALEWIKATGERLTSTRSLLDQVTAVDETDPAAMTSLRDLAASFRALAAEQRGSDPPRAAAKANFYLVSALTTYATAVDTAADAIDTGESALFDEAVKAFTAAGSVVRQATEAIAQTGQTCSLELGTPPSSTSAADDA